MLVLWTSKKTAIKRRKKWAKEAEVPSVYKARPHIMGMPRKKYGVQRTGGQATSRWQTNVQEGQGGWPGGHILLDTGCSRTIVQVKKKTFSNERVVGI